MKVRNLKANHSGSMRTALSARTVKVRNLKANHSSIPADILNVVAVLASVKVRNLKANHSNPALALGQVRLY